MPTPYSPGGGSVDALRRHLGAVELVGDLDQDAGAVAHQLVGADRAAMVEVLEDLQALLDDGVRFAAGDVGDEADAAGVVLVGGRVQARRRRQVHLAAGRPPARCRFRPRPCPDSATRGRRIPQRSKRRRSAALDCRRRKRTPMPQISQIDDKGNCGHGDHRGGRRRRRRPRDPLLFSILPARAHQPAGTKLADMRSRMASYFQKNLTYNNPAAPPCQARWRVDRAASHRPQLHLHAVRRSARRSSPYWRPGPEKWPASSIPSTRTTIDSR